MVAGIGGFGGSLGKLIVSIGTDMRELNDGLNKATQKVNRAAIDIGKQTTQIGQGITKFGLIVTAGFGLAAKASIDFESAFAGVRKTVDATEEEFDQLEQNFKDLSKVIPISAVELAKIGEVAGQLGIRGVANLTKFTKTIALLGETTNISGEDAALSLSRFIKVIGASQADIERLGATIVGLGNNFAARESEIVDLAVSLASFGRQINLSAAEVLAFATVIKSVGGEAQAASSAFQKMTLKMKDAVITGNNDLESFAKTAGVTADEFTQKFEEDAAGAVVLFLEGLNQIEEAGGSTSEALRELGLADIRLVREIGKVIGANEDLRKGLILAGKTWEENTALQEEAAKRFETTASQLKILWNNVVNLAIILGDHLLPVINNLVKRITPFINRLADWAEKNEELSNKIILLGAGIGALSLVLGPLLILIGTLIPVLAFAGTAIVTIVTGPIGFLIAALIGTTVQIGALALAWKNNWVGIREVTQQTVVIIGQWIDSMQERMLNLILFLQNWNAISIGERLAHPFQSMKQAAEDADAAVRALQAEGGIGQFGDTFADTMIGAGESADGFVNKIKSIKAEIDKLFMGGGEGEEGGEGEGKGEGGEGGEGKGTIFDAIGKNADKNFTGIVKAGKKMWAALDKVREFFTGKEIEAEKDKAELKEELMMDSYSTLKWVLQQQAGESKVAATLLKGLAIGEAIMNTANAVTKALTLPWPLNLAISSLVGAIGAAEIATIAGVQFAEGTDAIPARVHPGEMIVPRTFADAIRQGKLSLSGAGNTGGGTNVTISRIIIESPVIQEDTDIDRLAELLGDNINEKLGRI